MKLTNTVGDHVESSFDDHVHTQNGFLQKLCNLLHSHTSFIATMKTKPFLLLGIALLISAGGDRDVPNFELKNLKNQKVRLHDMLDKGPVLLDFWATWCKPCRKAFPKLNELQRKYGDQGLTVLGINEDGNRNQAKIKPFVKSLGLRFEVLIDGNSNIMRKFQVPNLPATVLISPDGKIISRDFGYSADKFKKLDAEIQALLRELQTKPPEENDAEN